MIGRNSAMGINRKAAATLAMVLVLAFSGGSLHAEASNEKNGLDIGFGLGDVGNNFLLTTEVTSPYFASDFLAIRAEGGVVFASAGGFAGSDAEWAPMPTGQVGLVGVGGRVHDAFLYYGEFGGRLIVPHKDVSDDSMQMGIYGYFGFEFFMDETGNSPVSYYIELGGSGFFGETAAGADWASGFEMGTGLRFHL